MKTTVTVQEGLSQAPGNSFEATSPTMSNPRSRTSGTSLRTIRLLHRYLGLLFSPAILFFAFSGALQTLNLHSANARTGYVPPTWVVEMAQIHKKQTTNLPKPKGKARQAASDSTSSDMEDAPPPKQSARRRSSDWPFKAFVVIMSIGLIVTTLLGIYMSFRYGGDPRLVWGVLLVGALLPVALLAL